MLEVQNIRKQYKTGELVQSALDGVSLSLRDSEFVAVLGPSGSGKTTLLNIIGGLDRYDSGDLIINGISTKKYKDRDWDSYRNHTIGFVFQSYNLIPHQSVLANVELALTISGISKGERRRRAKEALEKMGLGDQLHKRPSQMSGGQMQRVAIARALVNNPDVLLADEPTGALDTETSRQVMELLKEVSRERLVIMVTHNSEIANEYATRIVRLRDGKIVGDTNPYEPDTSDAPPPRHENMGKASMSYLTALSLSFNNLRTKMARTLLTSFAGSIGIIGIALILALSTGVNAYIESIQKDTMSSYPIVIEASAMDLSGILSRRPENMGGERKKRTLDAVYSDPLALEMMSSVTTSIKENNLTEFKKFLDDPESEIHRHIGESGIVYSYDISFDVYAFDPDEALVNTDGKEFGRASGMAQMGSMGGLVSTSGKFGQLLPGAGGEGVGGALKENFTLVHGKWPAVKDEAVLVVDEQNGVAAARLYELGILPSAEYREILSNLRNGEDIEIGEVRLDYDEILSVSFYIVPDCEYYILEDGLYKDVSDDKSAVAEIVENALELKIVGIIRPESDAAYSLFSGVVGYTKALTDYIIEHTDSNPAVIAQRESPDVSVISGMAFLPKSDEEKAADTKAYIANLPVSDKATMAKSLMGTAYGAGSADGYDAAGFGSADGYDAAGHGSADGYDAAGFDLADGYDAAGFGSAGELTPDPTAGMPGRPGAQGGFAAMGEPEMAAAFDDYIQNADEKTLLAIYDSYISPGSYERNMKAFGAVSLDAPSAINIYADSFESKDKIAEAITAYNQNASEENLITYTDFVALLMSSITTIINVISYVLIAFVAVSLVVSSIMIGIITYISVLERTKEIGILRAVGASKRNISQVFNAETFIIGLLSGLIGVGVTLLLLIPGNAIIHAVTGTSSVNAILPIAGAVVLVLLSMALTLIAGLIPSGKAAKKDPVVALRTE